MFKFLSFIFNQVFGGEKWLHHEKIRDSHKREGTQKVVVGRGQ